jgi:hypothetical protein
VFFQRVLLTIPVEDTLPGILFPSLCSLKLPQAQQLVFFGFGHGRWIRQTAHYQATSFRAIS